MFLFIKISAISCSGNQLNGNDILRKREENLMLNIHYFGVYHKFQKIFGKFFCISLLHPCVKLQNFVWVEVVPPTLTKYTCLQPGGVLEWSSWQIPTISVKHTRFRVQVIKQQIFNLSPRHKKNSSRR